MSTKDQLYLDAVRRDAAATADYFGESGRREREKDVVAAFAYCLGAPAEEQELVVPPAEPPDLLCRGARFEVTVVYDSGRKPHKDWKEEAKRRDQARSIDDLLVPYPPPVEVNFDHVVEDVLGAARRKCRGKQPKSEKGYPADQRVDLDLLIYLNQKQVQIADSHVPESFIEELRQQGWGSVSLLTNPGGAHVFFAIEQAPTWLKMAVGRTQHGSPFAMWTRRRSSAVPPSE